MEDLFRTITPNDLEGDQSAFFDKLQAVQKELIVYIDKAFIIEDELPANVKKSLNMSLGTILISIGILKLKAADTNPVVFLSNLIKEALVQEMASKLFSEFVDAPLPSVSREEK